MPIPELLFEELINITSLNMNMPKFCMKKIKDIKFYVIFSILLPFKPARFCNLYDRLIGCIYYILPVWPKSCMILKNLAILQVVLDAGQAKAGYIPMRC